MYVHTVAIVLLIITNIAAKMFHLLQNKINFLYERKVNLG